MDWFLIDGKGFVPSLKSNAQKLVLDATLNSDMTEIYSHFAYYAYMLFQSYHQ